MTGKELDARVHEVVDEMAGHMSDCAVHNMPAYPNKECDCGKSKSPSKYRIRWSIQGTTMVTAKDDDDAENQFQEMDAEHLIQDLISIDLYDVEPWPESGDGKP